MIELPMTDDTAARDQRSSIRRSDFHIPEARPTDALVHKSVNVYDGRANGIAFLPEEVGRYNRAAMCKETSPDSWWANYWNEVTCLDCLKLKPGPAGGWARVEALERQVADLMRQLKKQSR